MARNAIAVSQPRPALVSSYMQRGGALSVSNLARLSYTQLPNGTAQGYSIVAFGHVGRFIDAGGGNDRYVVVGLRWDNGSGIIASTLTRVPIRAPMYANTASGLGINAGHSWCAVLTVPAGTWPATTDLLVSATVEQVSVPNSSPGTFWADATTVCAFDHSQMTVVHNSTTATNVLPYSDVAHLLITDGTVLPATGRWITFYSAQVAPSPYITTPEVPHHAWLSKLDSGVLDVTYGVNGRAQITGAFSRTPRDINIDPATPDPLVHLYTVGGWYPVDVANANVTRLQIRGWTFIGVGTGLQRADSIGGSMFSVPESAFADAYSDAIDNVAGMLNRNPWSTAQSAVVEIGDDRDRHYTLAVTTMNDATTPANRSSSTIVNVAGFPQQRFPTDALHTIIEANGRDYMPNFASHIADLPPWRVQWPELPISTLGLLTPYVSAAADSGGSYSVFSFTPNDDPDRPPVVQRTMTYAPITLDSEIDGTTLLQLTADEHPSNSASVAVETGVQSFTTDDGHVIRWPSWSKARRAWRVSWLCDQARYQVLLVKLYRPGATVFLRMPADWPDAPAAIVKVSDFSAEQLGSNLVWRLSASLLEVVHST